MLSRRIIRRARHAAVLLLGPILLGCRPAADSRLPLGPTHIDLVAPESGLFAVEFDFLNDGNSPLTIASTQKSCSCLHPTLAPDPIPPGSPGRLTLKDSAAPRSQSDGWLEIEWSDARRSTLTWTARRPRKAELAVFPDSVHHLAIGDKDQIRFHLLFDWLDAAPPADDATTLFVLTPEGTPIALPLQELRVIGEGLQKAHVDIPFLPFVGLPSGSCITLRVAGLPDSHIAIL